MPQRLLMYSGIKKLTDIYLYLYQSLSVVISLYGSEFNRIAMGMHLRVDFKSH